MAVAAMLTVTCFAAVMLWPEPEQAARPEVPVNVKGLVWPAQPAPRADTKAARRVYPYSIVPGGVSSRDDLANAMLADKTVAAHYAGFDVAKASLQKVGKARAVYVSYRKGDQVYWTAKPVTLAANESVLSDGQQEIRARCGNRISDTPQFPVELKGPDEQELDTPLALSEGDGELVAAALSMEEDVGKGQAYALHTFQNGTGPVPASSLTSLDSGTFGDLARTGRPEPLYTRTLSAELDGGGTGGETPPPETVSRTRPGGDDSPPGDPPSGNPPPDGPPPGNPPPDGPPPGNPPPDGPPPGNPPPDGPPPQYRLPPQSQEVPEPDSLLLTGIACAALLLARRLSPRKSR